MDLVHLADQNVIAITVDRKYMITIIVSSLVALFIIVGLTSDIFEGPDNPVEETCEEGIKLLTGKDIDLSPWTPEPRLENQTKQGSGAKFNIVDEPQGCVESPTTPCANNPQTSE